MSTEAPSNAHVAVVTEKGKLEIQDVKLPELKRADVLFKVEACGVCYADSYAIDKFFPGLTYPRVPGHEVVGRVIKVGEDVKRFKAGDRVGRGWHGGHCFQCDPCVGGNFIHCTAHQVTGINSDGGYADYCVAPWESLARVPEGLKAEDAAPLLCAGVTVFNSLRNMKVMPGELVAVQGIGGLGHLGIQFARHMGYRVAALSTSADKEALSKQLGAHYYIDSSKQDTAQELKKLGGAKVLMTTVTDSKVMSSVMDGLAADGVLLVLGADHKPLEVTPLQLIGGRKAVQGWASGVPKDCEDTLNFAAQTGVRSYSEVFSLDQAKQAYERMLSNKARFRVVIVPGYQGQAGASAQEAPKA